MIDFDYQLTGPQQALAGLLFLVYIVLANWLWERLGASYPKEWSEGLKTTVAGIIFVAGAIFFVFIIPGFLGFYGK